MKIRRISICILFFLSTLAARLCLADYNFADLDHLNGKSGQGVTPSDGPSFICQITIDNKLNQILINFESQRKNVSSDTLFFQGVEIIKSQYVDGVLTLETEEKVPANRTKCGTYVGAWNWRYYIRLDGPLLTITRSYSCDASRKDETYFCNITKKSWF